VLSGFNLGFRAGN